MSYTYLLEQGEEYLAECFLDIPASVLLRLNPTQGRSYSNGSGTEYCQDSQSGMMSLPLMETHGEERLMSSAEDFPAKTLAQPERALDLVDHAAGYGERWPESLAKWDRATSSWRTAQCSLFGGLEPFSETWPRWGMTQDGESLEARKPAWLNPVKDSGFLPTLRRSGRCSAHKAYIREDYHGNLEEYLGRLGFSGWISPLFSETVMEWPIGWTDIAPLEMDKFQQWLHSHGKC
jgi:hypothetical protein